MNFRALAATGVLGLWLASPSAFANLILNGDFEAGNTGWTVTNNAQIVGPCTAGCPTTNPLWFGGGTISQNGAWVGTFNNGDRAPVGSFSQVVSTNAGEAYHLQFSYGVTDSPNNDILEQQSMLVEAIGSGTLLSQTVVGNNPPQGLAQFDYFFTANSATTTIRFSDVGTNATGSRDGILDNVSLVPEPASLALLGLGIAGLAFSRRRKWKPAA